MSERPPAYTSPSTWSIYTPANVPLEPQTRANKQRLHSPPKHSQRFGFEVPPLPFVSVPKSAPSPTPPSILETAIERAGFWLFFLFTVWLFGLSMCVLVLATAEFGLLPMALLQVFEMILVVDLHIPALGFYISILSAFVWSSLILNFLHAELPAFIAGELNEPHSLWHRTRRDCLLAAVYTVAISVYAVFSHGLALALVDNDKDLTLEGTLEEMLVGARWAVGTCVVVGFALVAHHWRHAKLEAGKSQALLDDYS